MSYQVNRTANEQKHCDARGCPYLRSGLDSVCRKHRPAFKRYGHPTARPLPRRNWAPYTAAIRHLFALNAGHAGLLEADRFMQSLMTRAAGSSHSFKGACEFARLSSHGVSARDVLVEALAVLCYLARSPAVLPDDRSRDFAVARGVFLLAPQVVKLAWSGTRSRPYRGKARASSLAFVGKHLRVSLAEFSTTVRAALEAQAKVASMTTEERTAARTAPMVVAYA